MSSVHIKGFAYNPGEIVCALAEVPELRADAELAAHFTQVGLREFRRTESSPLALAEKAISTTLSQIEAAPEQIDAVFYATSSFWDEGSVSQQALSELFARLSLAQAYPLGVTF